MNPIGYCVKERKKVEIAYAEEVTMSNGGKAIRGSCIDCGTPIYKIGKLSGDTLINKERKNLMEQRPAPALVTAAESISSNIKALIDNGGQWDLVEDRASDLAEIARYCRASSQGKLTAEID